jgi:hypothetical protein
MADTKLREIKRQLAQSPNDDGLKERWILEKAKVGEAMITTNYKICYKGKYYSSTSAARPWSKKGTKFPDKHSAIKALYNALSASKGYTRTKSNILKKANLKAIRIVEVTTYTVERDIGTDFLEEKTKADLVDIRKQKDDLAKQEQKILDRVQEQRKALLKQEEKLAKKIEKK